MFRGMRLTIKAGLFKGKLDIRFIVISTFVSRRADNVALTDYCFEQAILFIDFLMSYVWRGLLNAYVKLSKYIFFSLSFSSTVEIEIHEEATSISVLASTSDTFSAGVNS